MKLRMVLSKQKGSYEWQQEKQGVRYEMSTTWNEIAKTILPHCIPESPERSISNVIQKKFIQVPNAARELEGEGWKLENNELEDSSLREIIVQLKALGLIMSSVKKRRSLTDFAKYWALTKHGEDTMDHLCAIRKPDET